MSCVALVLEWERPLGALAGAAPKGNRGNPGGGGGKRCRSLGGIPGKRKAAEAARTELEAGSSRQRTSRTATSPSRTAGMSCVALVLEWERPLGALAGAALGLGWWELSEKREGNCNVQLHSWRKDQDGRGKAVELLGARGKQKDLSTQRQQRESWRRRWKTLSLPWWNSWETESSRSSKNRVGSRLQPAKDIQNCHLPLTDSRNVLRSSCFGMGTAVGSSGRSSTQRQQRESWRRRWKTLSLPWWNSWETESSRSSKNRVGSRLQPGMVQKISKEQESNGIYMFLGDHNPVGSLRDGNKT
ncbi:uncharacterized protein ACIQIH_000613 isoform 6-T6 [Cyanocitta cristata]